MKRKDFTLTIENSVESREHFHQDIELLFVLDGTLDIHLESKVSHLTTGDIYVMNSNVKHSFEATEELLLMRLLIRYQVVERGSGIEIIKFWCDSSSNQNDSYDELRRLLRRMLRHYVENRDYISSFGYFSDCYNVLEYLMVNFMPQMTEIKNLDEGERYEERLRQINNYIYQNYDHPISIKELSEKLFLSNGYLSRFFKKNYGMSFAQYLTNVRVFRAADDLLYSDEPITRVAYNNGFASAALFNKVFKKTYGQTPSEFRKAAVEKSERNDNWDQQEKRLEKMVLADDEGQAEEKHELTEVSADFDVRFFNALKNNWGSIINFGDASNLLHSSVREHLMILRQAFGFEYVRFCSLFTEEFYIRPGQRDFNFSQVDSVLDFILEQGMKPYMDLGIKSKFVLHTIGENYLERASSMDPYDVEEWEYLIVSFMRHITKRYGQHVMDDWYMELWFDENWRYEPDKGDHYLELFDVTYRAIKACNKNIKVGGYGIRMDTGQEKRLSFLKKWNTLPCRPDFLTVMFYGYERQTDGSEQFARRMTDNDAVVHLIKREKKVIAQAGMGELPLILNEWNLTPSVRNYIHDTSFKGAYIVKNTLDLYGLVHQMGYAVGSDRQDLYFDSNNLVFGGGGLLTKDAIMKPAAFAYDFLNRLFPYYVGKNSHLIITKDKHDNYSIVCHNQQMLSYNYFLTQETEMEKEAMWKYYKDRKKLDIHVHLDGVTDGSYRMKIYRINDNCGSVLKVWGDMDYEMDLSRDDIRYFRRVCEPKLTIRKVEAREGSLDIDERLQPNGIMFISVMYMP